MSDIPFVNVDDTVNELKQYNNPYYPYYNPYHYNPYPPYCLTKQQHETFTKQKHGSHNFYWFS